MNTNLMSTPTFEIARGIAFISSRYRGDSGFQEREHARLAGALCLFALRQGYSPYASHLLLPQFLDDASSPARTLGIAASHVVLRQAAVMFVYEPHADVSPGVRADLTEASLHGVPVIGVTALELEPLFADLRPSRLYNTLLGDQ